MKSSLGCEGRGVRSDGRRQQTIDEWVLFRDGRSIHQTKGKDTRRGEMRFRFAHPWSCGVTAHVFPYVPRGAAHRVRDDALTPSLRGALATKQSSLWGHWIASL